MKLYKFVGGGAEQGQMNTLLEIFVCIHNIIKSITHLL